MHRITRFILPLGLALTALLSQAPEMATAQAPTVPLPDSSWQKVQATKDATAWDYAVTLMGGGSKWLAIFNVNKAQGLMTDADTTTKNGKPWALIREGQVLYLPNQAASKVAVVPVENSAPLPVVITTIPAEASTDWWPWLLLIVFVIVGYLVWRNIRKSRKAAMDARDNAQRRNTTLEGAVSTLTAANAASATEVERLRAEANRPPAERFSIAEVRAMALFPVMRQDEGPAFIPGGINSDDDLVLALQRSAQVADAQRLPETAPAPHREYRFKHGTRGMVKNGTYNSLFSDGSALPRVILLDDPSTHRIVWRALAVSPIDKAETFVYTEEVCANSMGIPVQAEGELVWEAMPVDDQTFALPEAVIHRDPVPAPVAADETAIATPPALGIRTPDGKVIQVPIGSMFILLTDAETADQESQQQ